MPWEVLHFFANSVEVIAAIAGVLLAGSLIAITGLWILPKIFRVTPESLEDYDLDEEATAPDSEQEDARRTSSSLLDR